MFLFVARSTRLGGDTLLLNLTSRFGEERARIIGDLDLVLDLDRDLDQERAGDGESDLVDLDRDRLHDLDGEREYDLDLESENDPDLERLLRPLFSLYVRLLLSRECLEGSSADSLS